MPSQFRLSLVLEIGSEESVWVLTAMQSMHKRFQMTRWAISFYPWGYRRISVLKMRFVVTVSGPNKSSGYKCVPTSDHLVVAARPYFTIRSIPLKCTLLGSR